MNCPSCQQVVGEGNFCPHCGEQLSDSIQESKSVGEKSSIDMETLKQYGNELKDFSLQLIKKPSDAKNVLSNRWSQALTVILIMALALTIPVYAILQDLSYFEVSFFDTFIWPFIIFAVGLLVFPLISFGVIKFFGAPANFKGILTQYGAYLIPFFILYLVSIVLSVLKLHFIFFLLQIIVWNGIIFLIPTLIFFNYARENRVDSIYLLLGNYVVNLIGFFLIVRLTLQSFIDQVLSLFLGF